MLLICVVSTTGTPILHWEHNEHIDCRAAVLLLYLQYLIASHQLRHSTILAISVSPHFTAVKKALRLSYLKSLDACENPWINLLSPYNKLPYPSFHYASLPFQYPSIMQTLSKVETTRKKKHAQGIRGISPRIPSPCKRPRH